MSCFGKNIISVFILCVFFKYNYAQFLQTNGTKIVDETDTEVILKGLNANNWLLQEGYMMEIHGAQWEIEAKIDNIVGEQNRHDFYDKWRANYFTKADIDSMAAWGFNSVRAPFHYKWLSPLDTPGVFYERGFVELDSLISWCESNQMWLILDMHAAPGGQGENKEISDYNPSKPGLYESAANQAKFVEIWYKIAERYANNPWVGGYDLINEPNWPDLDENLFANVYQRAIDTIRLVDTNHIVFVEGQWFATSFSTTLRNTIKANDNVVWSFHKYWNSNDVGTINYLLDMRNQDQMPLWLGETGENSNAWFSELVELCDEHNIGWAWWGTKKIESISSIFEIPRPSSYSTFANAANNGSSMSVSDGVQALDDIATASLNENNSFNMDMVYSLIGYPNGEKTYPYAKHIVPGNIMAVDFDMGHIGEAYYDIDYANFGKGYYNQGWAYRNSGIDIGADNDSEGNGYHIGWTEPTEWMKYTVEVSQEGFYNIVTRVASNGEGKFVINSDSNASQSIEVPYTGGFNSYTDLKSGRVYLETEQQSLYLTVLEGGFDINKISLEYHGMDNVSDYSFVDYDFQVHPNPTDGVVYLTFDELSENINLTVTDITGKTAYSNQLKKGLNTGSYRLDLKELNQGIYFINIENNSVGRVSKPFYITR